MRMVSCSRWLMSRSMSIISMVFLVSRSPVGSSASSSCGLLDKARAIVTRCCSPPLNSDGRWSMRSCSPTSLSSSAARARRSALVRVPSMVMGSSTFSKADMVASKLKVWKMNPM
mmetsp:Transcript_2932/g.9604  ORF Transcript_2932/g.9604 Transcript_2932/m.9604 type:complete len:115 (-) Transcript_2932:431-775(-)